MTALENEGHIFFLFTKEIRDLLLTGNKRKCDTTAR